VLAVLFLFRNKGAGGFIRSHVWHCYKMHSMSGCNSNDDAIQNDGTVFDDTRH